MKFDISSLRQSPGKTLPFDFTEDLRVDEDSTMSHQIVGETRFHGQIHATGRGDELVLNGTVEGTIRSECTRCLAPVERNWTVPVQVSFSADRTAFVAEDEAKTTDYPDYPIRGSLVDLGAVGRDALLLAVPMQLLCRPDCAGYCPTCGQNLNDGTCNCEDVDDGGESPFDILKTLL
ncbi:MAG: YceD family protein [Fastidiosipilaceae bacterium]|jgi:uncharacterized protein|nr:hypothetical protein [Clostridiaceae bacterium]